MLELATFKGTVIFVASILTYYLLYGASRTFAVDEFSILIIMARDSLH